MTPKEKAIELIEKYKLLDYNSNLSIEKSKKCSLIVVDEILDLDSGDSIDKNYWQEVKQEIQKL